MDQKELLYSQFDVFNKQVIERYLPEVLDESDDIIQDIEEQISDYYRSTLIYLINEKRIDGSLIGSSPESRYNYFTNVLCQQGMILDEIEERFPTITQRVVISLKKYLELSKYVKEAFTADFSELLAEGYLDGVASDISSDDVKIKITGDIHNGNGVCIVAYQGKKWFLKRNHLSQINYCKLWSVKLVSIWIKKFILSLHFWIRESIFGKSLYPVNHCYPKKKLRSFTVE